MGHYYQGKTHYEYSKKVLKPHLGPMRKLMDVSEGNLANAVVDLASHLQKTPLSYLSGVVHSMFLVIVEHALKDDYLGYSKAVEDGTISRLAGPMMDLLGAAPTTNELLMVYHLSAQEKSLGPTYEISGALAKQLFDTELRGVYTDEVRLPFPSIYIDLPSTEDLTIYNTMTGIHQLCGAYVTEDTSGDVPTLRIYAIGAPKGVRDGLPDDATLYYNLKMVPGTLAEEAFQRTEAEATHTGVLKNIEGTHWRTIYSWVLNVILYLTWGEPGEHWMANKDARLLWERIKKAPKGSKKRKALHDRFRKLDPQNRIVLGRGIKYERPEGHKPGQKIASTFRVSGHWKRQRYGKGRQEEKRIFIEPYWKGSGDTALKPRTYTVK